MVAVVRRGGVSAEELIGRSAMPPHATDRSTEPSTLSATSSPAVMVTSTTAAAAAARQVPVQQLGGAPRSEGGGRSGSLDILF